MSVAEDFFDATSVRKAFAAAFKQRGASFPVLSFVVEHDDGHIVVDTGWGHGVMELSAVKRATKRFKLPPLQTPDEEVGPRMRAIGLRPEDVRLVIPTHLDCDHAGGIGHFPNSTILVNRAEHDYVTKTRIGQARAISQLWPDWFEPSLYDLEPQPYGAFQASKELARDVVAVPTPGHSPSHISPVFEHDGKKIVFIGDHVIRADWVGADAVKLSATLHVYKKLARDTNARLLAFVKEFSPVLLPSHDPDAAANAASL